MNLAQQLPCASNKSFFARRGFTAWLLPVAGVLLSVSAIPAQSMLKFPPTGTLVLAERTSVSHYRVAAIFSVPVKSTAVLRARGQFPELQVQSFSNQDFVVVTTTIAIRRDRNLPEAGRLDRDGCGLPPFPKQDQFRLEGACSFERGGNALHKRMIAARDKQLLHLFSITYRQGFSDQADRIVTGLRFRAPHFDTVTESP